MNYRRFLATATIFSLLFKILLRIWNMWDKSKGWEIFFSPTSVCERATSTSMSMPMCGGNNIFENSLRNEEKRKKNEKQKFQIWTQFEFREVAAWSQRPWYMFFLSFILRFLVFYLWLSAQGCARKASTKWIPVLDIGGSGNQIQHPWAMCNCTTVLSRHLNTNKPHNHLCHLSYIPDSATKRLSESFRMNHTQNPGGLGLV